MDLGLSALGQGNATVLSLEAAPLRRILHSIHVWSRRWRSGGDSGRGVERQEQDRAKEKEVLGELAERTVSFLARQTLCPVSVHFS